MSAQLPLAHVPPARLVRTRVPLNTLAIPLGLAGLAQVWSVATSALGVPFELGQAFRLIAATAWIWTALVHLHRGTRADQPLSHQLTHFAQGPLAALLPIAAMLLGASLHRAIPFAGTVLTLLAMAAAAAFAAWILSFWMRGELPLESVHGGYFLPISAAGFVGALAAAETGLDWLAVGSFAVGIFFWLVISVFFFLRLALRPTVPAPLVPTLAIMIAPPAVASAEWLTISGGRPNHLFEGLTAMTAFMVLIQVMLLPRYRALPFSLGFWSLPSPRRASLRWQSRGCTYSNRLRGRPSQSECWPPLRSSSCRSRRSRSSCSAPRPARHGDSGQPPRSRRLADHE